MSNSTNSSAPLSEQDAFLVGVLATFIEADPDVLGVGAMIGFLVAGGLTQIFSLFLHRLKDCKSHTRGPKSAVTKTHITYRMASALAPSAVDDPLQFWINIISALLIGFSDQQLVMGLLVLAIIIATKGASFSMYMATYISYFTLITHAATMVTLRPYFRKFRWLTFIRILTMLAAYCLWIISNATILGFFFLIQQSTQPKIAEFRDSFATIQEELSIIFGIEVGVMTWIYLSMVPSLFISDELVKVRKAVARWPIRKERLDDVVISDWLLKRRTESQMGHTSRGVGKVFGDLLLRPYELFCRLFLRTKSQHGRVLVWLVAEGFFPWATIPLVLLALFISLLVYLSTITGSYSKQTEWNFGQILPVAMVVLPFWALAQTYAEDRMTAIEEKDALEVKEEYVNGDSKTFGDKSHTFGNDISIEPVDEDFVEAAFRPRSSHFADL